MLTVRRPIVVGGIFMLAAVFTCAIVLGEPARPANPIKTDKAAAKDADFAADDSSASLFADKPLIVYQGKDNHHLFALQVQPKLPAVQAKPRDLIVLVDTTASQAGGHLIAAEKLVETLVAKLGKDDRISIRTVNLKDSSRDLTGRFRSPSDLAEAVKALKDELPMGAADLKLALQKAIKAFKGDEDRQQAIVYIGDGMSIRNPFNPSDVADLA